MTKLYGAIEAGGTKFVCAVSDENLNILKRVKIPTTVPAETMAEVFKFFEIPLQKKNFKNWHP